MPPVPQSLPPLPPPPLSYSQPGPSWPHASTSTSSASSSFPNSVPSTSPFLQKQQQQHHRPVASVRPMTWQQMSMESAGPSQSAGISPKQQAFDGNPSWDNAFQARQMLVQQQQKMQQFPSSSSCKDQLPLPCTSQASFSAGIQQQQQDPKKSRFPVEALSRQGVSIQDLTVPRDMLIPTNSPDQPPIALQKGQRVMVIRTPKGIYLRMNDKIIKIKLPPGLLGNTAPQVKSAAAASGQSAGPKEVVTLSDSSDGEEQEADGVGNSTAENAASTSSSVQSSTVKDLYHLVASAGSSPSGSTSAGCSNGGGAS